MHSPRITQQKKVGQNWETRMIPDIVFKTETFSMKQSLNFANILSSICNIYFLIAIFQLHSGNARRSVGKTHSGITKAVPLKKLGPHFWLLSKSASKDAVTLTFLTFMHFYWHITFLLTHNCHVIVLFSNWIYVVYLFQLLRTNEDLDARLVLPTTAFTIQ